ncbi:MAG TPA: NAD(P)/FAD-dependent oxidoreductase [Mycobacterium sp.]|nr:NAD(P)/FAD-dependent oxidoreductase [Mycobacterium sp.]
MASIDALGVKPQLWGGSKRDEYDVVVIGAGMAGLTAGALLAHAGKSVLVVEADEKPGGYTHALCRDGYTFDRADNLITSCSPDGPFGQGVIDAVLRELGVRDQCEFVRVDDPFYVARYPDLELAVPCGREPFLEAHLRHFPREEHGLRRLAELCAQINREILSSPLLFRTMDLARMPLRSPTLFRYRNATMRDVIDRELSDPRLKEAYSSLWTWVGTPPSQSSFVIWAAVMANYIDDGAYYCLGGFDKLVEAVVCGLERAGGELLLGRRAVQILTDARGVTGVELDTGHRVSATTVVSAIDAPTTFNQLLEPDRLPARFARRLRGMDLSMSISTMYLGTDLDARALGAQHENLVARSWDHERAYAANCAEQMSEAFVVIPSLTDPSLAPPGHHVVIVQGDAPRESGATPPGRARAADHLLSFAEQVLPGLRDHLTFVEPSATGADDPRVHRMGPIYGWSLSPGQFGPRRLSPRTPVNRLFLAGQWTQPAHGVFSVMQSGVQAARLALGVPTAIPAVPLGLTRPIAATA